jgi:hypothetical protein
VTIPPSSVEAAAAVVVGALQPGIDADWSVRAGDLEWSVDRTIAHTMGAPAKYAFYLSSRSTRYVAVRVMPALDATRQERLEAIEGCAAAFAGVAATAPGDAFGFHVSGMRNADGFLTMACEELLVHTYDITCGLGLPYEPPEELCRLVLEHSHPGQYEQRPVWPLLLWLNGRRHSATAGWGDAPKLDRRSDIPLEFARDLVTGEWRAVRWVRLLLRLYSVRLPNPPGRPSLSLVGRPRPRTVPVPVDGEVLSALGGSQVGLDNEPQEIKAWVPAPQPVVEKGRLRRAGPRLCRGRFPI